MLDTQANALYVLTQLQDILNYIDNTGEFESSKNTLVQLADIASSASDSLPDDIRVHKDIIFDAIFSQHLEQSLQDSILSNLPEHLSSATETINVYTNLFLTEPDLLDTETHTTNMLDVLHLLCDDINTQIMTIHDNINNHLENLSEEDGYNLASLHDNKNTLSQLFDYASHAHDSINGSEFDNSNTMFLALFYHDLPSELQTTILAGLAAHEADAIIV